MGSHWYQGACPNCGNADVQQHSRSAWCLRCGWARNREARRTPASNMALVQALQTESGSES